MHLTCLDFVPTEEQLALMKRALKGDRNASGDLACEHDILYLPELDAWFGTDDPHIEAYRCGYISAAECKTHFPNCFARRGTRVGKNQGRERLNLSVC